MTVMSMMLSKVFNVIAGIFDPGLSIKGRLVAFLLDALPSILSIIDSLIQDGRRRIEKNGNSFLKLVDQLIGLSRSLEIKDSGEGRGSKATWFITSASGSTRAEATAARDTQYNFIFDNTVNRSSSGNTNWSRQRLII